MPWIDTPPTCAASLMRPASVAASLCCSLLSSSIAVSNQAESGESVAGALSRGRFDKIWAAMNRGDHLFIQFGHNDMKSTAPDALDRYTADLRRVVDETRKRGGIPVLLTPVSRRSFNDDS